MWSPSLLSWSSVSVMWRKVAPCWTKSWPVIRNVPISGPSSSTWWSNMDPRRKSGEQMISCRALLVYVTQMETSVMITHKMSSFLSPAGCSLIAWSTWVFQWKRSSSSSSATWSTKRSTAPHRASRQSKRRQWSLWKLKAQRLQTKNVFLIRIIPFVSCCLTFFLNAADREQLNLKVRARCSNVAEHQTFVNH